MQLLLRQYVVHYFVLKRGSMLLDIKPLALPPPILSTRLTRTSRSTSLFGQERPSLKVKHSKFDGLHRSQPTLQEDKLLLTDVSPAFKRCSPTK